MTPTRISYCTVHHGLEPRRTGQGHCLECHNEANQRRRDARRAALSEYKTALGCWECGAQREGEPSALHFHHRDPTAKLAKVGALLKISAARLWAEVAKCDVLCANYHAVHYARS